LSIESRGYSSDREITQPRSPRRVSLSVGANVSQIAHGDHTRAIRALQLASIQHAIKRTTLGRSALARGAPQPTPGIGP